MPRNGSGTYSVPSSFTADTTIESGPVNSNFSDVGTALTGSLPRNGEAGMTGQFKAANGTAAAPGVGFSADTDTGFFRKSGNIIGIACGGAEVGSFDASGLLDVLGIRVTGIPTGSIMFFGATSAPTGWVRLNGRTIGTASSGATELANSDTENLFTFLWTNYSDAVCPVSGGRGASAAADYAANKPIALPDWRGRAPFGLDDMGSSAAGVLSLISGTVNGQTGGSEDVSLLETDLPSTSIDVDIIDPGHSHTYSRRTGSVGADNGVQFLANISLENATTSTEQTDITATVDLNAGMQTAINKLPPLALTTFIMKL